MNKIALVTDAASLPIDFDMPLLIEACKTRGLQPEIVEWDDPSVEWQDYDAALLRSPWSYTDRLQEFLQWCDRVTLCTRLLNPAPVVRWGLDKRYLGDLARLGVPVVPTTYISPTQDGAEVLREFFEQHADCDEVVIKPTVGAYSRNVGRFARHRQEAAAAHIQRLTAHGGTAIAQPYLASIDSLGETDMIYFSGHYSHAIRKAPLLGADGSVGVPSTDTRSVRVADDREKAVASAALEAAARHLGLSQPLLYARVDLIRDNQGNPVVLELEISEPSLSLPFEKAGAARFAAAICKALEAQHREPNDIRREQAPVH